MSTVLEYYLSRITGEHRNQPNFVRMITTMVKPLVDQQVVTRSMPPLYDIDHAAGAQLDAVGLWVGATRFVEDVPYSGGMLTRLDDYHYRILLRSRIIANHWDGTIPDAYSAWSELFAGTGLNVKIQDNGDMTMTVTLLGPSDPVTQGLFVAGLLPLKPAGVAVTYEIG
jgi:hypothetical protein